MWSNNKNKPGSSQTCFIITEKYFYIIKKQAWSKYKHAKKYKQILKFFMLRMSVNQILTFFQFQDGSDDFQFVLSPLRQTPNENSHG